MNQIMGRKELAAVAVGGLIVFVLVGTSGAIPNQHLNPHSDAAADISWPAVAPGNPDAANHMHLVLRGGEAIAQNATSISSNMGWSADSVWDDRFFRFADTVAADGGANALAASFGHGYIDPSFRPRYTFTGVPALAQPILSTTFTQWNVAANAAATAVGRVTPAGTPTRTSIKFTNVAAGPAEFDIQFYAGFQTSHSAFAEWMPSAEQIVGGSPVVAGDIMVMAYESNPTNSVFTRGTWEMRVKGGGGPWVNTVSQAVGWHYGAGAPPVALSLDLEYTDDGGTTIVDQLPGPTALDTNTFDTIAGAATDVVNFYPMDFQTIAIHESGHILGLLHDPTNAAGAAGNIMRSQIAFNAGFGRTMRSIDGNSGFGAAILYSIPVPEPATTTLLILGLMLLPRTRRRRVA